MVVSCHEERDRQMQPSLSSTPTLCYVQDEYCSLMTESRSPDLLHPSAALSSWQLRGRAGALGLWCCGKKVWEIAVLALETLSPDPCLLMLDPCPQPRPYTSDPGTRPVPHWEVKVSSSAGHPPVDFPALTYVPILVTQFCFVLWPKWAIVLLCGTCDPALSFSLSKPEVIPLNFSSWAETLFVAVRPPLFWPSVKTGSQLLSLCFAFSVAVLRLSFRLLPPKDTSPRLACGIYPDLGEHAPISLRWFSRVIAVWGCRWGGSSSRSALILILHHLPCLWGFLTKNNCGHVYLLRFIWLEGKKQSRSSLSKKKNLLGRLCLKSKLQESER